MKIHFILLLTLFLGITLPARAQVNCMYTLKEAKELYDEGLIDEIPKLLEGCMEDGFTRAQRIEAYKLIILAYLFDDNQFDAEKTMDDFLHKFPEYEVMPNDPVEFVYLLESYKTSSLYSLNLFFGNTLSNPRVNEDFSTLDMSQTNGSNSSGSGFQFGFGVSRNIWKSIFINIDAIYSTSSYTFSQKSTYTINSSESAWVDVIAKESLQKFDIPLTATYHFGRGNIRYYGRLGGQISFINKVQLSLDRSHPEQNSFTKNKIDIQDNREKYLYAVVIGGGVQYKVPHGFLSLGIRYQYGLQPFSKEIENNMNSDYFSRYFYSDSDFTLDYLSVNIGYYFTIYQSRKKRD